MKKEIENKENKINLLSKNNKILQGKINKLTQSYNNKNLNNIGLSVQLNKKNNYSNNKISKSQDIYNNDNGNKNSKYYVYAKNKDNEDLNNLNSEREKKIKYNEIKEKYEKERENQKIMLEKILYNNNNKINENEYISINDKNKTIKLNNNNEQGPSINISQEVEYPIIESSYVILKGENEENLNNDNIVKENLNEEEENEIEVKKLHNYFDKILNEF